MLTPLDDYQCHQAPDTVDHAATHDLNFYERYWFNFGDDAGEALISVGLAGYPNRQVVDGFAIASLGSAQHNLRLSRDCNEDRDRSRVGPLRVEVLEGLRRLRVVLEPNEHGLELDVTFEARQAPWERGRDFSRWRGRVLNDYLHLNQMGVASGRARIHGEEIEITPERWYALRDRSWGIRPGDPAAQPPPGYDYSDLLDEAMLWQFICAQWPDAYSHWQRRNTGTRVPRALGGAFIPSDGGAQAKVVGLELKEIEYARLHGDLRRFRRAVWEIEDETGRVREVTARALRMLSLKGGGYGGYKGFHHGAWRAPSFADGESWDLAAEEDQRELDFAFCHEYWSEFECDGVRAVGMCEISDRLGAAWVEQYLPGVLRLVDSDERTTT
jgi:hypothetical protein